LSKHTRFELLNPRAEGKKQPLIPQRSLESQVGRCFSSHTFFTKSMMVNKNMVLLHI